VHVADGDDAFDTIERARRLRRVYRRARDRGGAGQNERNQMATT